MKIINSQAELERCWNEDFTSVDAGFSEFCDAYTRHPDLPNIPSVGHWDKFGLKAFNIISSQDLTICFTDEGSFDFQ